jgi:hypothetical protein
VREPSGDGTVVVLRNRREPTWKGNPASPMAPPAGCRDDRRLRRRPPDRHDLGSAAEHVRRRRSGRNMHTGRSHRRPLQRRLLLLESGRRGRLRRLTTAALACRYASPGVAAAKRQAPAEETTQMGRGTASGATAGAQVDSAAPHRIAAATRPGSRRLCGLRRRDEFDRAAPAASGPIEARPGAVRRARA